MLLVPFCGIPQSGKTECQKILEARFAIHPIDDGRFLRETTAEMLEIPYQWTTTTEGKNKKVVLGGREWTVREVLGELGNAIEDKFGELIIPTLALRDAETVQRLSQKALNGCSFGSVRKTQPAAYLAAKNYKCLVIEVVREGAEPTGNGFDLYDKTLIQYTFLNPGDTKENLDRKFTNFFAKISGIEPSSFLKWGQYEVGI